MFDSVEDLLAAHDLASAPKEAFPNDGWSGSVLTAIRRGGSRYVLKRTSLGADWIVRATDDRDLREARVADGPLRLPDGVVAPYLGVARDGDGAALLMPDLSGELLSWVEGAPAVDPAVLDTVLVRLAALHAAEWWPGEHPIPWCPLDRRLTLLTRPSAERYRADGLAVGDRFIAGWDAFERRAPVSARDLVRRLSRDVTPLTATLGRLPGVGLHGDMKLANVAVADGRVALIDWQMALRAPVAVELGWLLVSNVAFMPEPPDAVLARYRAVAPDPVVGDWEAQVDLTWIVGLVLRGWRKGLDAEAGIATGSGQSAEADLAWWSARAVAAADRRL